uniref:Uncharacterized protein n=1 Tax=Spongospora subterranea TaxID=70186 RepID=A0A0H5RCL5_9EUKA|eukprot:CRZ11491.1 hypothetical protein [Spongospora subterranea]
MLVSVLGFSHNRVAIGQEGSCVNISYLLAKGTLDDIMWPLLQRKLSVCNEAVDAGKGNSMRVQFDRVADNVVSPNAKRRKVPESLPVKVGPMDRYVLCRPRFSSPVKRSESIIDDMHPASQSPRSDGRIVIRETRPHDSSPRMSGNRPRTPSGKTGPALVVLSDTDNQIIDLTQ